MRGEEGTAIVVTVRNTTKRTLQHVPIAVSLKDASGRILYRNDAPGLEPGLVSVGSLAPHQTLSWVDDQLPPGAGAGTPWTG